jgi:integrase
MQSQSAHVRPATLAELVPLYLAHAAVYYRRRDGSPTREHLNMSSAISSFMRSAGPDTLLEYVDRGTVRAWRDSLILEDLSRGYINASLARLRRFVRWAVEEFDLPAGVLSELACVRSLPAHRSSAREPEPRQAADLDQVRAVLAYLPGTSRDVCQLLLLTGARLGEVLEAQNREIQLDPRGGRLVPHQHKTAHHDRRREIPLNPDAMVIIGRHWRPLLPLDPVFPPAGQGRRRSFSPDAVRAAIRRACKRAGVPAWTPHQLRHAVATVIRDRQGLDAACALLGHAHVGMTEHYAPLSFERAAAAAAALKAVDLIAAARPA